MDALKYGSYMSGLYGSMANSSTSTTDPTNTTSNSNGGGNKSPYMNSQQEMSPKSYETSSKSYESSNNGVSSVTSAATSLAASGKIITMKVNCLTLIPPARILFIAVIVCMSNDSVNRRPLFLNYSDSIEKQNKK